MQSLYGGGTKLQVPRRIYRLFSLAERWKLVATQKEVSWGPPIYAASYLPKPIESSRSRERNAQDFRSFLES